MQIQFADRMGQVHRSFVAEMLRVAENPETISFAGGIPNSRLFPVGEIAEQLTVAKQAADFHSDYLSQRIVHRYLVDNDLDAHIEVLRGTYRRQRDQMLELIARYIPPQVRYTNPDGGMFVWMTLPEGISSLELLEITARENVAFVPGRAFHLDESGDNTMRLSYSMSENYRMEEGMKRLAAAIRQLL